MPSPFQYVSFGGVSLQCSTPELEEQVNRLLPIKGWRDWDGWNFSSAGTSLGPLPTPTAPVAPPVQVGVLHWPNDATRPAWFHAVGTQALLDAINAVYTGPAVPQDLILKDGREGKTITAKMSMLPPRPLSQLGLDSDGWLLTFTDKRFWWQWRSGSIGTAPASWTALFESVGDLLGSTIEVDTIDSAYGVPTEKWIGYLRPPATVLDTVAASVGQRIVVDLDGTVRSVNWETAKEDSDTQWAEEEQVAMGGYIPSSPIGKYVPAAVNVAGIDRTQTGPNGETMPKTEEKTLTELAIEEYEDETGASGSVSTVFVDFEYEGSEDDYAFSALATAAAIDWYGWRLADLDIAFPGVSAWGMTGWEDFVEWMVKLTDPWIDPDNPHEPLISTKVRRPPFSVMPSTVLPTAITTPKVYIVKLTGTGAGVDGGTAWAGLIQEEESGAVVDNGYLGGLETPSYCLYRSLSYDGTLGSPAIGDRVYAVPDKDRPGVWLFIPKKIQGFECGDCGWLADVPHETCFKIRVQGGSGRCSCLPAEGFETSGTGVWVDALSGWLSTQMKKACCGCGAMVFRITGPNTATLTLHNFHVSCSSPGGLYTLELTSLCCGVNEETGKPYVKFRITGAQACDGEQIACDNTGVVTVECYDCPDFVCGCCCTDYGPWSWYTLNIIGFGSDTLNGAWVWTYDDDPEQPCRWSAECYGINSVIEFIESGGTIAPSVVRLTHGAYVYEIDRASWSCHGQNTFTYVSGGGTHPGVVVVDPAMVPDILPPLPCSLPDSLDVEMISADCPNMNFVVTATRTVPGIDYWEYSDVGVLFVSVQCNSFGRFVVGVTIQCDALPVPLAFEASTSPDAPDSSSFDPLELQWDNVPITGADTPPVPDCCVNNASGTIIVTES